MGEEFGEGEAEEGGCWDVCREGGDVLDVVVHGVVVVFVWDGCLLLRVLC